MKSSKSSRNSKFSGPAGGSRKPQAAGRPSARSKPDRAEHRSSGSGRTHTDAKVGRGARGPAITRQAASHTKSGGAARKPLTTEHTVKNSKQARPVREFHIWGRRPIENYIETLMQQESFDRQAYALHIIADKAGRVPAQLKGIVEPCKAMGLRIHLSQSQEDESWPLNSEEVLNHQRVCLRVPKIPTSSIHDIVGRLPDWMAETPHGCLGLVLDQIQDPRNFGAIIRTAAFYGAKFVVFGEDRQAELTPLVVKTSSGGAFSLELVPTVNINRALEQLKKSGLWVVGSSLQATARHSELPADRHYVLIVGNESKGMRQEVGRQCDYLVRIPGGIAAVDSLNVGVATGVLLDALQGESFFSKVNYQQSQDDSDEL